MSSRRRRRQDRDFHHSRAASGFCLKYKARLHRFQYRGIQLRVQLLFCCATRPRVSATRVLAAFARAWWFRGPQLKACELGNCPR